MNLTLRLVAGCMLILAFGADPGLSQEIEQLPYYFGLGVLSEPGELQVDVGGREELCLYGLLRQWIVDAEYSVSFEYVKEHLAEVGRGDSDLNQDVLDSARLNGVKVHTVRKTLSVLESRLLPDDPGMSPESREKILEEFAPCSGATLGLGDPVRVADTATLYRGNKKYTVIHLKDETGNKLEILMPEPWAGTSGPD